MAAVYGAHEVTPKGNVDIQILTPSNKGCPCRQDIADMGLCPLWLAFSFRRRAATLAAEDEGCGRSAWFRDAC